MFKYLISQHTGIYDFQETYIPEQKITILSSGQLQIHFSPHTYGVITPKGSHFGLSDSEEDSVLKILDFLTDLYLSQTF